MKTTLRHIANIQTGIFAKPSSKGEIAYLQSKHFDETGQLQSILHPDLKADNITEKHLLRIGDVLFAAKGTKNFATLYESKNQLSVASTSFFVIRIKNEFTNKIFSEFLVCLLNHPLTQKFLKGKAIGSSIASISKSVLEDLEISIPEIKTQKAVLKISQLYNTEKKINQQIQALREKQIQQQIINAIK